MKMTRREFINKKHGKAYRTLLRNLKEARKHRNPRHIPSLS